MSLWLPACLLNSGENFAQYKFRATHPKNKKQEQMLGEVNNKSEVQASSSAWSPSLSNLATEGLPEVKIMPGLPLTTLGSYPVCVYLI